ncbi:gamma carbonic anhydrase family protein [bacterium]|nr:gamma carbonic anhydrase family protein [bacterium]
MILKLAEQIPQVAEAAFIAPDSWIIGAVTIGKNSSVFFNVVIRGDILPVKVGSNSNLQEHVTVHTSHGRTPAIIGDDVTVGHRAIIHGATVCDRVIIGMGSIILDEARISSDSIVGAGSLVTEGKEFPPRSLVLGSPAKVVRELTDEEVESIQFSSRTYVKTAQSLKVALAQS